MEGIGKMGIDLTGGLPERREHFFSERPENPEMRDSASMWIFDDRGEIAIPRVGIEALAKNWDSHDFQLNVSFADGRVFRAREPGAPHSPLDPSGLPRVLGAGPVEFRCVEPYKTWTVSYDGAADATSVAALIAGNDEFRRTRVEFHVSTTMAVPPWEQGTLSAEARDLLENTGQGDLMGRGERIEQLFRCTGTLRVDGEEHTFSGSGLRIKRQGTRQLGGFWGHAWQSAVFTSGRAFGYIAYPPRTGDERPYNEGFIYSPGEGALTPARVVSAPWLRELAGRGEDVSLVLETLDGRRVPIAGTTYAPTHDRFHRPDYPGFPVLFQGGVRYEWDGEVSHGMLERSSMRDQISWPAP
jgi:prepilin-type processing-associated H-X9-DG protein